MKTQDFLTRCEAEDDKACTDGAEYALQYETMEQVWDSCERVEWLIWILIRIGGYDRELRLFACDCAGRSLSRSKNPDPRSIEAVRIARLFADGLATAEELREAEDAAHFAAWSVSNARSTMWSTVWLAARSASRSASWSALWSASWSAARPAERKTQLKTLKVLIANPFTKKDITK